MKKQLFTLCLVAVAATAFAQSNAHRFHISGGFGFQQYRGDLGEGFYRFNSTEYGVASLAIDYALCSSFDLKFLGTLGDLGFCHTTEERRAFAAAREALGHIHGENPYEENLNSRMGSGIVALQYKLANGRLLPIGGRLTPFMYAGAGINRLTDRMEMGCVVPGVYYSLNMGAGFKFRIAPHIFAGYTLSFGWFTSDGLDFIDRGSHDMYMQNSAVVGYAFSGRPRRHP